MKAQSISTYLKTSVGAIALVAAMGVAPAFAQDSEGRLDVITVTAEKREASILDTPVSVSSFDADTRDELGITSAADIANHTPGMTFQNEPNRITIRGIGRLDNAQGSDPGVATYVDGAYTSEAAALNGAPLFVDRIEVLRGPQGTLFGRNAIGGLVNVIYKRPEAERASEVRLRYGKYNDFIVAGTTTGSISENTRYRVNAMGQWQKDGSQDNNFNGPGVDKELGRRDNFYSFEVQLEHDFTDRLSGWFKYNTSAWEDVPSLPVSREAYSYTGPTGNQTPITHFGALVPSPFYGYTATNPSLTTDNTVSVDFSGSRKVDNIHNIYGELSYEADWGTIKYLGTHQEYDYVSITDADGTSRTSHNLDPNNPSATSPVTTSTYYINYIDDYKDWDSHELQITSNQDQDLRWIAGLYYYSEKASQNYDLRAPQAPAAGTPLVLDGLNTGICFGGFFTDHVCGVGTTGEANPDNNYYHQLGELDSTAFAAYGQIDYDINDVFSIKAGLRYTKDEKSGYEEQTQYAYNPFGAYGTGLAAGVPQPWIQITPNNNNRELENEWDAVTGTLGVNYTPNSDLLVYGNYTRGYKSGGMRLGQLTQDSTLTPQDDRFVDAEFVDAFEVGAKGQLLDGNMLYSVAAYFYDYENQQAPINLNVSGIQLQSFVNVPQSTTKGIEADIQWAPNDYVVVGANWGYLDSSIEEYNALVENSFSGQLESVEGNSLPRSPQNSYSVYSTLSHDMGDYGDVTFVADAQYVGDQHTTLFEDDVYTTEAHARVNTRFVWNNVGGDMTFIGGVNNIFDENSENSAYAASETGRFARVEDTIGQRTWYIEAQKRF